MGERQAGKDGSKKGEREGRWKGGGGGGGTASQCTTFM